MQLGTSFPCRNQGRKPSSVNLVSTLAPSVGMKERCQHPQEADCWPWVAMATWTGAKVWKNASDRVNDKCKPCSMRQGDSGKKMRCCVSRCLHQALLVANNLEVSERTLSKTKRHHILGMQSSHLMNKNYSMRKDSHQPAMHR